MRGKWNTDEGSEKITYNFGREISSDGVICVRDLGVNRR
jgi:hypothetical protein